MTLNELIKTAHADAKAKGWWDEERNTGELLMLIVSECGEALEAHRSGKMGDLLQFDARYPERNCELSEEASLSLFRNSFEDYIKDSFSDELADIVIRIADFMGYHEYRSTINDQRWNVVRNGNVGEALFMVVGMVARDGQRTMQHVCWSLDSALTEVFGIAKAHNIDLWRHIELKLAYNRTRPHRHGKAY
jgi:NTP pyrophosphatase (non-canonical NTP hydrolase)